MFGLFFSIASDTVAQVQLQLSVFTAVALVFAVASIDNMYGSLQAQQATGAGWLIFALVDVRPPPFPNGPLLSLSLSEADQRQANSPSGWL